MNTHDVDERIRAALNAAADAIGERDLSPEHAPTATRTTSITHQRARWLAPLLAAAAVIVVAAGTAAVLSSHSASSPHIQPGRSVSPPVQPTVQPTVQSTVRPTVTAGSALCSLPIPACEGVASARYEPLWPFDGYAQAKAWQASSATSGAQPWHVDAGQTALLFTQNYLGFKDIVAVTSTRIAGDEAHIGVGYAMPNGRPHTAAVLHLVRYTPTIGDTTAGWEVVGSDDTDFSLEQPAYGSTVTSPMTVGGHITGVDENITVVVLPQRATSSSGAGVGLPAGGTNSPWHLSVPFGQRGVLTIVASTGGHLTQHERFAIQGVQS